jgi:hypothetical protein
MFNKVTDIIDELKKLQVETENIYIETAEEEPEGEENEEDEDD